MLHTILNRLWVFENSVAVKCMESIPSLTQKLPSGAEGGLVFEKLMHQLLIEEGKRKGVVYEATSGPGGDYLGVDGFVRKGNILGVSGPFGVEFKWLWGGLHESNKSRQIEEKFLEAMKKRPDMKTWVLVTPLNFSPAEQAWFDKLSRKNCKAIHWGKTEIDNLLYNSPVFLAYYCPSAVPEKENYKISDFNSFLYRYTAALTAENETLRLIGIPTKSYEERDQKKQVPLRKIFVPQYFQTMGKDPRSNVGLPDILESASKFKVILGDPGTGKTTMLTFLALLHMGKADLKNFEKVKDFVPIIIPIREFIKMKSSNRGDFWKKEFDFIDFAVAKTKELGLSESHRYFFEYLLKTGNAMVLFDGLDEVGKETERSRIAVLIRCFSKLFPESQIYVTSRIVGYSGDVRLPENEFEHYAVAPLDSGQISKFVENWYEIQIPQNEYERIRKVNSMITAINRHPRVKRLATNPLLLTLMALIHEHETQLPRDRGTLYDRCIDMLIFRWELRKMEELGQKHLLLDVLKMPEGTVRRYLAELAFWVQTRNENVKDEEARGIVSEDSLLEFLTDIRTDPSRGRDKELARQEMTMFVDYIRKRAGLLVEKGFKQFSFVHLSFLEFLAAEAKQIEENATDEERIDFIVEHLDNANWREVILLLVGLIGNQRESFLDNFLRKALPQLRIHESENGLETLGRMLCDNLSLRNVDADEILGMILSEWLENPTKQGRWDDILSDIALFADRYEGRLKEIIDTYLEQEDYPNAIHTLVLRDALFEWDPGVCAKILRNPDFERLAPQLLPFWNREGMKNMLKGRITLRDRFAYRVKMGIQSNSYLGFFAASLNETDEIILEAELAWTWRQILAYHFQQADNEKYPSERIDVSFFVDGITASHLLYTPPATLIRKYDHEELPSTYSFDVKNKYTGELDPAFIVSFRKDFFKSLIRTSLISSLEQIVQNSQNRGAIAETLLEKLDSDGFIEDCVLWLNNPTVSNGSIFSSIFIARLLLRDPEEVSIADRFRTLLTSIIRESTGPSEMKNKITKLKLVSRMRQHNEPFTIVTQSILGAEAGEPVSVVSDPSKLYMFSLLPYVIWMGGFLRTTMNLAILQMAPDLSFFSIYSPTSLYKQLWDQLNLFSVWDSIAKYYGEKQNMRLFGLKGALFLAQAALVSQTGGCAPISPTWNQLLRSSEKGDKRLEISAILYEVICNPEKASQLKQELKNSIIAMKKRYRELFSCAGFLDKYHNCGIE
jgi:acyl carrier protein